MKIVSVGSKVSCSGASLRAVSIVLLFAGSVLPQESVPKEATDRLGKLLEDLRGVPPPVWAARMERLERSIAEERAKAGEARQEAARLVAEATKREAAAAALEAEIAQQRKLMSLVLLESKPTSPATPTTVAPASMVVLPIPSSPASTPSAAAKSTSGVPASPTGMGASNAAMAAKVTEVASVVTFEDVLPVFESHCTSCHNPDDPSSGLDLSSYASVMKGAGSGVIVQPKNAQGSRLYRVVAHLETPSMPPDQAPIEAGRLEKIRAWIDAGAPRDTKDAAKARAEAVRQAAEDAKSQPAPKIASDSPAVMSGLPVGPPRVPVNPSAQPVPIKSLASSPAGPLIAVPGREQVLLRHADTGELLSVLPFELGEVEVLRFSRDGTLLLAAGGRAGLRGGAVLYDVVSGDVVGRYGREFDSVLAAAISPKKSLVALGGASKKVRVYRTEDATLAFEISAHNEWIESLDVSPDGNLLVTTDRGGAVFLWQADTGRDVHTLRGHRGAVHAARFRPDAKTLATVGEDGTLRIWDCDTGNALGSQSAHAGAALSVAWGPDLELVTGGADGLVKCWKSDGSPLATLPSVGDFVYGVDVLAAGGRRVVAGGHRGSLPYYGWADRRRLGDLSAPVGQP